MNRRLGNFVRVSLFALPFALPAVAFAQSAGGSSSGTIGATDNTSARQSRPTATTQTGTFDDGKPMDSNSGTGHLGIDREGNSTRDNDPVQTGDVDQHMTKQKATEGTTTTPDSTSSTTTPDKDHDAR